MVFSHKPRLLTEIESTYFKNVTEFIGLHEIQQQSKVKWQRTVEYNSELKNKLNKHATEQSEKLSDLKKLQSMQFYKNYFIGLN